MKLFTKNLTLA